MQEIGRPLAQAQYMTMIDCTVRYSSVAQQSTRARVHMCTEHCGA